MPTNFESSSESGRGGEGKPDRVSPEEAQEIIARLQARLQRINIQLETLWKHSGGKENYSLKALPLMIEKQTLALELDRYEHLEDPSPVPPEVIASRQQFTQYAEYSIEHLRTLLDLEHKQAAARTEAERKEIERRIAQENLAFERMQRDCETAQDKHVSSDAHDRYIRFLEHQAGTMEPDNPSGEQPHRIE